MIQVRLRGGLSGPGRPHLKAGSVVDLPDDEAEQLLATSQADRLPLVEEATLEPAAEQAVHQRIRRRRAPPIPGA